jgi:hypothetical protein
MSGVAESLLLNLVAELIFKSVQVAWDIIRHSHRYEKQAADFNTRIEAQIGILNAIGVKVNEAKDQVRPKDLITYYKVEKKVYHLLLKYVHGGALTPDQLSFEEKMRKLEESSVFGENTKQSTGVLEWFYTTKKQIMFSLQGEKHDRKLVKEIEEWSNILQEMTNWTIVPKLPQASREEVILYIVDPSGYLTNTNLRARIILAKSGFDSNVPGVAVGPVDPLPKSFRLPHSESVEVLPKGTISVQSETQYTINSAATSREIKMQLGGSTLRQWALVKTGALSKLVIVEFCPKSDLGKAQGSPSLKPPSDNHRTGTSPKKLDKLVETLRMAASDPKSFRVLYTKGWYEVDSNYYGLVYEIPATIRRPLVCESLANILLDPNLRDLLALDLGSRFKLARGVAHSLLAFHEVNWVHKSFYPENILVFGDVVNGKPTFQWSTPYLVGFGTSRETMEISTADDFKLHWSYHVHSHPHRNNPEKHRPYKVLYDVYSLGVILLEVGRGTSLTISNTAESTNWGVSIDQHEVRENLVEEAMKLPKVVGREYRDVVLTCLKDELEVAEVEGRLADEFRTSVCQKLDLISV